MGKQRKLFDLTGLANELRRERESKLSDTTLLSSDVLEEEEPQQRNVLGETKPYVGVTKPDYPTEDYQTPEGFIDYDSLGTTREEREKRAQQLNQTNILGDLLKKQPPRIKDTTTISESTKQPEGELAKYKPSPEGLNVPMSDFESDLTKLKQFGDKVKTPDDITNYNNQLEGLKKKYPALNLDDEVIKRGIILPETKEKLVQGKEQEPPSIFERVGGVLKELSPYGETPAPAFAITKAIKNLIMPPTTEEIGAENFAELTRVMNQKTSPSEADKQGRFAGTELGKIYGSFFQGGLSIPQGLAGFGEYLTDKTGITFPKESLKSIRENLKGWGEAIAPENPNFAQQLSSGFGSFVVFLPFGMGAMKMSEALMKVSPNLAKWFGAGAMSTLEAMTEAGSVYEQSGDPVAAEKTFLANMLVLGITNKFGYFSDALKNKMLRGLVAGKLEGLQEGIQEIISAQSQGLPIDWDNVITSTEIGAILGYGGGIMTANDLSTYQRQAEKKAKKFDSDYYSELSREFKNARRKRNIFDTDVMREAVNTITTPEIKTKAEELYNEAIASNDRLKKGNEFTLENLSQKKFGTRNINSLTEEQSQELITEYNSMKAQGFTTFKELETIVPTIKEMEVSDAGTIRSSEEITEETAPGLDTGADKDLSSEDLQLESGEQEQPRTPELREEEKERADEEEVAKIQDVNLEPTVEGEGVKKPEDVHTAAKEAGIDYESKEFMDKSKELTGKEHLDEMNPEQLGVMVDYVKSQKPDLQKEEGEKIGTGKYLVYDASGNVRFQETDVNEATRKAVKLGGHYEEVMVSAPEEKVEDRLVLKYANKINESSWKEYLSGFGDQVKNFTPQQIEELKQKELNRFTKDIERIKQRIQDKDIEYLRERLHTGNKNSRAFFEEVTGWSLGKTNRDLPVQLDLWKNSLETEPKEEFKIGDRVVYQGKVYEIGYGRPDRFKLQDIETKEELAGWFNPEQVAKVRAVVSQIKSPDIIKREKKEESEKKPESKLKQKIKSIENDELKDALDDYLSSFDLKEGIDPIQLAKGVKVISVYAKLGTYKFADIAVDLYAKMGDKLNEIFDSLKQAYSAYRETAPDDIYEKMDSSTRGVSFESIKPKETEEDNLQLKLVDTIYKRIEERGIKDNPELNRIADEVYGGSKAQGKYTSQDAYNALETAVNRLISEKYSDILEVDVKEALKDLRDLIKNIPTQSSRTQDKDLLQQFSTPPTLAYFANKLLNSNEDDIILEPSAGTGGLIAFQKNRVKKIYANEIDPKRKQLLDAEGYETDDVDAEFINSMLPKNIIPTKIIMNPPFSATGGRVKQNSNKFGYKHITSALQRLKDGGRLVAIIGEGAEFGRQESNKLFWDKVIDKYTVKADIGIENTDYGKYGTSFGNRIIVIDKTGATPEINGIRRPELQGTYKTIEEALDAAENIISSAPRTLADDSENVSLAERPQGTGTQGTTGRIGTTERGPKPIPTDVREPGTEGDVGKTELQPRRTGRDIQPTERKIREQRTEREGTEEDRGSDTERTRNLVEYQESDISEREEEKSGFVEYKPKQKPKGSQKHPAKLVEAASMAAVESPNITYKPNLPEESITEGKISDAQLETIAYAGQRHNLILPNGSRAGFFVGDGTGVGKGRIIAGILHDNYRQGRKKSIWISVSTDLQKDARRDLDGVGAGEIKSVLINDYKLGEPIPSQYNGVVFTTYSSLISGKDDNTRMKQITDWLGEDGIIVFDEAHKAKNILASGRGGKPTKTAEAVVDLQETHLPKARVVYASATGATNVKHMGYMTRLGMWGEGLPFASFMDFMNEIERGGIGAMEMVARDLKALGMYSSRSISFDGIEYEESEHILTNEQRRMYDTAARAWQVVMQNIDAAIELTGNDNNAKRWAYSAFWGAHQRFFKQFITALKVPTLIKEVEKNLTDNKSVVISMIGTHEASTSRAVTEKLAEGGDLEDLDLSPREVLANLVDRAFPVIDYEEYTDDNGNRKTRAKKDKNGNAVINPEAEGMKNRLLEQLSDINLPENPLDQIINYFELESHNRNDRTLRVAELTGRKKRLVKEVIKNPDPNAKQKYMFGGKTRYDKRVPKDVRAKDTNIYEMNQFQTGKKRIALISQAASTGISLHADKNTPNNQRRVQVAFELSWSADTQMQTFGRTHRSNQEVPPIYILLSSEVGGEKRFSSTIAKRLASLGALTRGERGAAGGSQLAKYDFENEYGEVALTDVYRAMLGGARIEGIEDGRQTLRDMGVLKFSPTEGEYIKEEDMKSITLFLNRILGLELGRQNALFDFFAERFENIIVQAKESGSYDEGVTDIKAESIKIVGEPKVVATDPLTNAETKHFQLEIERKTDPISWSVAKKFREINDKRGFFKQVKSGNVVLKLDEKVKTDRVTGDVERTVSVLNAANNRTYLSMDEFEEKYERINEAEAKPIWEEKFEKVPKTKKEEIHIISGAILPLWKEMKRATGTEKLRVARAVTDTKQRVVGIQIPQTEVGKVLRALNVQRDLRTPTEIFNAVLEQGDRVDLAQGLQLKKMTLYGDDAIELVGRGELGLDSERFEEFRELGLINERIAYKQRFFIPSDPDVGIDVLVNLLEKYPATKEGGEESLSATDDIGNIIEGDILSAREIQQDNPNFEDTELYVFNEIGSLRTTKEDWVSKYHYDPVKSGFTLLKEGDEGYVKGQETYEGKVLGSYRFNPNTGKGEIRIYGSGMVGAVEELAHHIQRKIEKENPALQREIERWERYVRREARDLGINIPIGREAFVKAYLVHLGWEKGKADFFRLPPYIIEEVNNYFSASKTGKDNLTLMLPPQVKEVIGKPEKGFSFERGKLELLSAQPNAPPQVKIPGESKIQSNETNKTVSEKNRAKGINIFEGNIEDINSSDLMLSVEDNSDEINDAMKKMTNKETTRIALQVSRNKITRFKKWAKRYFDQGLQPPVYMADKAPIYRQIYDVTEKYYVRDFTRDYNKILEEKTGLNKFHDIRKLSKEERDEVLTALKEYHEQILYSPTENLEGHPETFMEFVNDYKFNPEQVNALKKISDAYDKGLELIKQGEKIYLRDHVNNIFTAKTTEGTKYLSVNKFKKELPKIYKEIKKAFDEVSAEITPENLNIVWNQNAQLRTEVAEFLVEDKYHEYGQYLYLNLSRPLTKDSTMVALQKKAEDTFGEEYTDKRFTYFESEVEAKKYIKVAKDAGWEVTIEGRVKDMINDVNVRKEIGMMELIRLIEDSAIELPSEDIAELFKSIKARGWSKHTIKRNYTPGLKWTDEELETNLKNYLHEASTSKNKFLGIIKADELYEKWNEGVNEQIKSPDTPVARKEELKSQAKWIQKYLAGMRSSDKTVMDTVRGITAIWRLGFVKVSFLFQQTLQNFQMALPLAQAEVGFNRANRIFVNSMEDTTKLGLHFALEKIGKQDRININPELLELVKNARLMRKISAIGTQEFFGSSDPAIYYSGPVKKLFNRISFLARALSSGIEIMTRLHSGVIFFQIGKQKGLSGEKLEKYVIDNLDKTMGEYGKGGRIVIFNPAKKENLNTGHLRRAVAKSYLVFKTFATHNLGLWRLLIRNKNYGALFTKFTVGVGLHGFTKFPFVATLFMLAGLFFDDDEESVEYEVQKLENEINDKVGGRVGSLLNRGIGTYADVDISDLMAEAAPLPTESAKYSRVYGNDLNSWSARIIEGAFGAPYGTADDFLKATGGGIKLLEEKIKDEETLTDRQRETALRNVRKLTPDFLRNILNSMVYKEDGVQFRGKEMISDKDLTSYELLLKALSFQPEKISKAYEKANVKTESSGRTRTTRSRRERRTRSTRETR